MMKKKFQKKRIISVSTMKITLRKAILNQLQIQASVITVMRWIIWILLTA